MVRKGNNLVPNTRATRAYPEFLKAVREASGLPETRTDGQVSAKISEVTDELAPSPDTVDSLRKDLSEELKEAQKSVITPGSEVTNKVGPDFENTIRGVENAIRNGVDNRMAWRVYILHKKLVISGDEVREILGLFQIDNQNKDPNPDKAILNRIIALEKVEIPYYNEKLSKATRERNVERAETMKEIVDWCELKADELLTEINRPTQHEVSKKVLDEVVENNEKVTLEKVKSFLKRNGLALGGVTITIASFITAVVSILKSGVRYVKNTGNKVADVFKKIAKKLGPILGPLFSLMGTAISLLAKGAGWLVNNLWLLLVLIAYLIYDYAKWRSGKK